MVVTWLTGHDLGMRRVYTVGASRAEIFIKVSLVSPGATLWLVPEFSQSISAACVQVSCHVPLSVRL